MSKKFPEDVLAEILGIPSHNIGNVILTAGTNSELFNYSEPHFVGGRLNLQLSFNIVAKDRELFKHIEESYILENDAFGTLRLVSWNAELLTWNADTLMPWVNWLAKGEAILLRGSETESIVRSFI